ncbi:MAG: hypothetical protein FWD58_06450 [Firmicutes bacterium]|nr:hypothetical protein [Bacillota bacterium]
MSKKRCLLTLSLLFSALVFAGCASEVEFLAIQGADGTEHVLAVKLDRSEESVLNDAAQNEGAVKHTDTVNIADVAAWVAGEPWTLEQYLTYTMHLCGIERDAAYEKTSGGRKILAFRLQGFSTGGNAKIVESYPYINVYEFRAPNPFNAYRAQFDRPAADSPFDIFKNGKPTKGIPPFAEAFPRVGGNLDLESLGLDVKYTMKNFSRYEVGDGAVKQYDEQTGYNVYTFAGKFDKKDKEIVFRFIRPNQTWWYITAILAGFIAVGLVFLIAKFRKAPLKASGFPQGYYPPGAYGAPPSDPFAPQEPMPPRPQDPFESLRVLFPDVLRRSAYCERSELRGIPRGLASGRFIDYEKRIVDSE